MANLRTSRVAHRAPIVVLLLAAALVLASCGSSSSSGSATSGSSGSGDGGATTTTSLATKLFADDFSAVCQGASQSRAREYVKTGTHKALYFQTFHDKLQDDSTQLPTDWTVQFSATTNAYAATDIVACGVRTTTKFVKTCTGYQDKGKDTGHKVRWFTADYKVTVWSAKTAKQLGSTQLSATDTDCPMFETFDPGQTTLDDYAVPDKDALTAFLKPYVQP